MGGYGEECVWFVVDIIGVFFLMVGMGIKLLDFEFEDYSDGKDFKICYEVGYV